MRDVWMIAAVISLGCAACGGSQPAHRAPAQPEPPRVEALPAQRPIEAEQEPALVGELSTGTWGWPEGTSSCEANPHSISFSDDRTVMEIRRAQPLASTGETTTVYDIEHIGHDVVRGRIRGETRRTPGGKLVVWDLRLVAPGAYCWHRTDWDTGGCTDIIRRCAGIERLPDGAP